MKARSPGHRNQRFASLNVYADLGYHAPDRMFIKAQLVSRIAELLAERRVTQIQAATMLGIPQPELSKLLRGQFRGFPERRLVICLARLRQDVLTTVRPKAERTGIATVSVTSRTKL